MASIVASVFRQESDFAAAVEDIGSSSAIGLFTGDEATIFARFRNLSPSTGPFNGEATFDVRIVVEGPTGAEEEYSSDNEPFTLNQQRIFSDQFTFSVAGAYTVRAEVYDNNGLQSGWHTDNRFASRSETVNVYESLVVGFAREQYLVREGYNEWVTIELHLDRGVDFPVEVEVRTTDATAERVSDYSSVVTTVRFSPHDRRRAFRVRIVDNSILEDTLESFNVQLALAQGTHPRVVVNRESTRIIIEDDDYVEVSFDRYTYLVEENGEFEIGVIAPTRGSCASMVPFTVHFSYDDPGGVLSPGWSTFSFDPCHRRLVVRFQVGDVTGDTEVVFTLDRITPAFGNRLRLGDVRRAKVTILERDTVNITVKSRPAGRTVTVNGRDRRAPFTFPGILGRAITLDPPPTQRASGSDSRFAFSRWAHGGPRSQTVAPTSNATYTAVFTEQHFLSTRSEPSGPGIPGGDQWYDRNSLAFVGPAPERHGYEFSHWRKRGRNIGDNPAGVRVIIDGPALVEAVYVPEIEIIDEGAGNEDALSECYPGVEIRSVTVAPLKIRAGDGIVRLEVQAQNEKRQDRQIALRTTVHRPDGDEVEKRDWVHTLPKATGVWGFANLGKSTSSFSWAIPASMPGGEYSVNAFVLSEDKSRECGRDLAAASFTVLSSDSPQIVDVSPTEDVLLKEGYDRTFTASATDLNGDLSEFEWYVGDERMERATIGPVGSHTSEFPHTFSAPGNYEVKVVYKDRNGRSDSFIWAVEVSDLSLRCRNEENVLICGYASEWARDGDELTDTFVIVSISPPSTTGALRNLEVTVYDPDRLGTTGTISIAAPRAAWIDYNGIRKSIQIIDGPIGWSTLSPSDERDNYIEDRTGRLFWGVVPVAKQLLTIGDLLTLGQQQPYPGNASFQDEFANCYSQVHIPWHGPYKLRAIRVSIPVDLPDDDYVAVTARFKAIEDAKTHGSRRIESGLIEIHDVLNFEQNNSPPPCTRTPREEAYSGAQAATANATELGFVSVSAGHYHTCAVRKDGSASCWGADRHGQSTPPKGEFVSVSSGVSHTCGLKRDGSIVCWGSDTYGQAPTQIVRTFNSVSAGSYHTCGVERNGSVTCWGRDNQGQATPQVGSYISVSAGNSHACGLGRDGSVSCWGNSLDGRAIPPSGVFTSISASNTHTCGIKRGGLIVCWGSNGYGQASAPSGGDFASVSAGPYHTCGTKRDGSVTCWGSDRYGKTSAPPGVFNYVTVGNGHSCGVKGDGSVVCWGWNRDGQATPPDIEYITEICQREGNPIICGYTSEWAHTGHAPSDATLTVKLSPPSRTGDLSSLEITIRDPDGLGSTGLLNVAAPSAAWINYGGISKSILVSSRPETWSRLGPHDEQDNFVIDEATRMVLGVVPGVGEMFTIIDLFSLGQEQPFPRNAALRDQYRNCFSQVAIPWYGPDDLTGIRIAIPIDLSDDDYVALAARFQAKGINSMLVEISDLLNPGQSAPPPACGRTQ